MSFRGVFDEESGVTTRAGGIPRSADSARNDKGDGLMSFRGVFDEESGVTARAGGIPRSADSARNDRGMALCHSEESSTRNPA
jgi:hypothetical protein